MKKILVITLLLILCCGCVSKPALVNVNWQEKAKELQDKLGKTDAEGKVAKAELEKLQNDTLEFMKLKDSAKSMNFRVWEVIKTFCVFIVRALYQMVVATWFSDLLWIAFWIIVLTWVGSFVGKGLGLLALTGVWGMVVKALTFWMGLEDKLKIITTIVWALVLSALWKFIHSPCDWIYILIIGALACALANVVWEYLANKTGLSDKTTTVVHNVLAKKLAKV